MITEKAAILISNSLSTFHRGKFTVSTVTGFLWLFIRGKPWYALSFFHKEAVVGWLDRLDADFEDMGAKPERNIFDVDAGGVEVWIGVYSGSNMVSTEEAFNVDPLEAATRFSLSYGVRLPEDGDDWITPEMSPREDSEIQAMPKEIPDCG